MVEARPPVAHPYGYTDYTAYSNNQNFLGDQIELLKSAALAQRVAKDFRVDMPAPNPAAQAATGFFAELVALVEAWLGQGDSAAKPPEETPLSLPQDAQAANQAAIEAAVRSHLDVTPVPQTNLISISLDDTDPRRAAALANAVAKTYVTMNRERRSFSSSQTQTFYDTQVRETRAPRPSNSPSIRFLQASPCCAARLMGLATRLDSRRAIQWGGRWRPALCRLSPQTVPMKR